MEQLELLNDKINDPEASYNWVEYKEMNDSIKEIEEKIDDLMLKLEKLDA